MICIRLICFLFSFCVVKCLFLPSDCKVGQYYDSGSMTCQHCNANLSMVTADDGFGCVCDDHSIPTGIESCKSCNATDMVSTDGTMCTPRRCQISNGKVVCRRCPSDYISVTQNLDGSPLKEVQCVKCARGYRAQRNTCVKCESCTCNKNQIIVRGICIAKSFINSRPKYEKKNLHPYELLDIIKHEYLCTQNNSRSCRTLANICVKNFYISDPGGPCRLWTQPKLEILKGLPQLTIDEKEGASSIELKTYRKNIILLTVGLYTFNGGFKLVQDFDKKNNKCQLPLKIKIGEDENHDCIVNTTELSKMDLNETLAPYLQIKGEYKPLSVTLRKPDGYIVQKEKWILDKFRRYFIVHNFLSTDTNRTHTIYLRTLLVRLKLEKNELGSGSLKMHIEIEARYSLTTISSDSVVTSLRIENEMPSADIVKVLEIWGGVLGALTLLYAMVQFRGTLRRGGYYISIIPLACSATADTLYFAAWFTTLHALAAEEGTLGMTLPLSNTENYLIQALVFSAFGLKVIKVVWINWRQCQVDIFCIDWSEYNASCKEESSKRKSEMWRLDTLIREWRAMQCKRRVSPGYTVTLALLIFHIMSPWFSDIYPSSAYKWCIATIAWWISYVILLTSRWTVDRLMGSLSCNLPKICQGVGLSLLVFEEEYYAHYVHGRNDDFEDGKSIVGTLATCRIVCAPQFRNVYKQLSVESNLYYNESKEYLLSKFLTAFFERSLEGMSWVASERSLVERLLNIEVTSRESGYVSTLLYDNDSTPSCFILTWWGQEWTLSTFDALLFSLVLITSGDILIAAFVTLVTWQVMKAVRKWFGDRNVAKKLNISFY